MTDKEKLIELIQSAVGGCARHWAELIADNLLAHGVTFATDTNVGSKWISVEDELPNGWVMIDPDTDYREPETYIVFVKGAMLPTTAYFLDGKFVPACDALISEGLCDCPCFAEDITHWMQMPVPPKEG